MNEKTIISIGEAAIILGVHIDTLRNWDKQGFLVPIVTPGKHRRYLLEDILKIINGRNKMVKNADESVAEILEDFETDPCSSVVKGIKATLEVLNQFPDLNYGSKVRVLTKALSVVNEEHRQYHQK